MTKSELEFLKNNADINWCVDIFKRIEEIINDPQFKIEDLSQIQYLVKQGLKVKREDE